MRGSFSLKRSSKVETAVWKPITKPQGHIWLDHDNQRYINIISEHVYVAATSFFQVHSSLLVKIYSVYCPCYTREVSYGTKFALTRTLCYFELRKLVCSEKRWRSKFFIYLPNKIETRPFAPLQCLAFVLLLTDITEAAEFLGVEDVFTNLPFNLYRNLLFLPEFFLP